nr:DegT/DnrJ/EryC1/StrS family aminotransferase [Salicibibacter kimchii]
MTTLGEGALVVSNDLETLGLSRFLGTQAREPALFYQYSEVGYNYRMSNIVAGVGRGQLEVLDRYNRIALMPELEETISNRWLNIDGDSRGSGYYPLGHYRSAGCG